jgi:hypothetical protein
VLVGILLSCAAFLWSGTVEPQPEFEPAPKQVAQSPSSATAHLFPCLQASILTHHKNRVVVLHGPDWILQSSVRPSCFPEREVVFITEVGRGIVSRPYTAKIRMWVTKDHDVTHIRIVESSASSREQEMVAVGLVSNHKCTERMSKNCSVQGGAAFVRID